MKNVVVPSYIVRLINLPPPHYDEIVRSRPQSAELKIYVAAVEALRKKERQDETQFTTKIVGKTSYIVRLIHLPPL
jgi:hypothetical protein